MSGTDDKRNRIGPRKVVRALLMVADVPLTLLALSLFGLFPWSGVNCCQSDIDLTSGRTRHTCYLLWMPVTRIVTDSALTKALSPEDRMNTRAEWHPVVTLSPGLHHSPHYRFHGAISQIQRLEISWKYGKMTPAARQETAEHILHLWRQSGDDIRANHYVQSVWERVSEAEKTGTPIDLGDVPVP